MKVSQLERTCFLKKDLFLELLAYGKDKRQKYQVIKFINKSQY